MTKLSTSILQDLKEKAEKWNSQRPKPIPPVTDECVARFYSKTRYNRKTKCLEWTAGKNGGYGNFSYKDVAYLAHRFSAHIHGIKLTKKDWVVAHSCDNKICVNPAHLKATTPKGNCLDRDIRLGPPKSKLSALSVKSIRAHSLEGHKNGAIGKRFNVTTKVIRNIVQGKTWRFIK